MKKALPVRHTIRFRRWSRKAYAAFASIGRCVSIGCLRKNVADSSLSKQKTTGATGHVGCDEGSAWRSVTEGCETDSGIPPGSSTTWMDGATRLEAKLQLLFATQATRTYANVNGQEKYRLKQRNNRSTDYPDSSSTFTKLPHPDNPCFFLYNEPNHRKI